jgi:hypothetical protein
VSPRFQHVDLSLETDSVYKNISTAILQSAKEAIPVGRRTKFKPYWNKDLEAAVQERKKARRQAEKQPIPTNKNNYNYLTAKVKLLSNRAKKKARIKKCEELDLRNHGNKAW